MRKITLIVLFSQLVFFVGSLVSNYSVQASVEQANGRQNVTATNPVCAIFPFISSFDSDFCTNPGSGDDNRVSTAAQNTGRLIRLALQLVFVGIIVIAIYVIIKASVMYIRSEGEQEKVESAKKAIKTVFAGVAALFVGIIGLILVIAFFDATGALNVDTKTNINEIDNFTSGLLGE